MNKPWALLSGSLQQSRGNRKVNRKVRFNIPVDIWARTQREQLTNPWKIKLKFHNGNGI